jgi:hypothetical protein
MTPIYIMALFMSLWLRLLPREVLCGQIYSFLRALRGLRGDISVFFVVAVSGFDYRFSIQ